MIPNAVLWLLALVYLRGILGAPAKGKSTRITIGYRRVHPNQAAKYNEAGTLTDDPITGHTQIGNGVYLSAEYGVWEGNPGDKDCVITVDEDAFRNVPKVILPDDQVLDSDHGDIDKYIQELDNTWDPEKTVRISHIPKYGLGNDILQMAIPPALLNSRGGGLDIKAECKDGQGARGPTVDYGQWDDAKGAKLKRLSDTDKVQTLADMVKKANEYIGSASTLDHVELLETRATNAMYTAREGAGGLAQFAQECQGSSDLKKLCKDLLKYYIRDREEYANFLNTAATKSLDIISKSFDEKKDADAKSKAAQELKDWLARLQDKLDAKVRELEAIKNGNPTVVPGDNPRFLAIEKEALQSELGVMKKGLKKIVNDATALEAKENLENTSSGSKDKSAIKRFKDWLGKTWDKVFPSKGNEMGDNGQSPGTADDPDTSKTDNDKPPPKNQLKPDPNRPPPKNPLRPDPNQRPSTEGQSAAGNANADNNDRPPPKNPLRPTTKPPSAGGTLEEPDGDGGDAKKRPKKPKGRDRRHSQA